MKTQGRPRKTSEAGTSTVEAALILLMFCMLLFGVYEAGRFMNTRQILTNAAREGARFAVTPITQTNTLPNQGEVQARVDQFLATGNVTGATVQPLATVTVDTGLVMTSYTQVTVEKTYSVLTVPWFFSVLNVTVSGDAMMRNETSD
jgi:Flp pilus assembly protein TadG